MQLRALHGLLPLLAAARLLRPFSRLERLSLAGGLPACSHDDRLRFQPDSFPPSLRQLDMPVPHHPFKMAGGLPRTLTAITLRSAQDFLLTRDALGSRGGGGAVGNGASPAAVEGSLPPSWRQLEVHAGRTAGLDLDDLRLLPPLLEAGSGSGGTEPFGSQPPGNAAAPPAALQQRRIVLVAPQVMLSTADPGAAAQLAAPLVRSREGVVAQILAVLAPVLAAARLASLRITTGEVSFYCRRPGRLCVLDAEGLPPAGSVRAPRSIMGYTATLTWPAGTDAPLSPSLELCIKPVP